MAKEFIIRDHGNWQEMVNTAWPWIATKPFRVQLLSGLKRTLDQNALMHAVFEECVRQTKLKDAHWWKNELKCKLGLKEVHFDIEDQPHVIVLSTTQYNTAQMAKFCEKIVAHMKTDYNVDIVLPEELNKTKGEDNASN